MSPVFVKLLVPMVGIAPKNVTLVKLAQSNALSPMLVTDAGIIALIIFVLLNELSSILITLYETSSTIKDDKIFIF